MRALILGLALLASPARADDDPIRLYVRKAFTRIGIYGHFGFGLGEFREPAALSIGPGGVVAVSDLESHCVIVFDRQGRPKMSLDANGPTMITPGVRQAPAEDSGGKRGKPPPNALLRPLGVAYDPEGNLWVTEERGNRVRKYDPQGNLIGPFGGVGTQPGRFRRPKGIHVHTDGRIFVADYENFRVQVFDRDFRYIEEFTWRWNDRRPGAPGDVAVDHEGNLWVAYTNVHRVVKLSPTGEVLAEVGGLGTAVTEFRQPRYVACDINGDVYVSDYDNHRVAHFDPLGRYVYTYGFRGNNRGQFKRPMGIDVSRRGSVHIADSDNFRYQILRIDPLLGDLNLAEAAYRRNELEEALELYLGVLGQAPYIKVARDRVLEISEKFVDVARVEDDHEAMRKHLATVFEYAPSDARARRLSRWLLWVENKDVLYKVLILAGLLLTGVFFLVVIVRLLREA